MSRDGKAGGVGVNLRRQSLLGMPHGLHGDPGWNVAVGHPHVEGHPHGVQIEAQAVLIDEGDSSGFQILSEVVETPWHRKDRSLRIEALRACLDQRGPKLRMDEDRVRLAVLRGRGPELDEGVFAVQVNVPPLKGFHLAATEPGVHRDQVNQAAILRRDGEKGSRLRIGDGSTVPPLLELFDPRNLGQGVLVNEAALHQPVQKGADAC